MARALFAALSRTVEVVASDRVSALLLTAEGKHFCVGVDIQAFVDHRHCLPVLGDDILRLVHPAVRAISMLPVPMLSVVRVRRVARALSADLVPASDALKLRCGYTAIGLSLDGGASWFVTRCAGGVTAKRIFMRNQSISTKECLQRGLIDGLHPPQDLLPAAEHLAQQVTQRATGALAAVKQLCGNANPVD